MIKNISLATILCSLVLVTGLKADQPSMPKAASNKDFDRIKNLSGVWEGSHMTPKGEERVSLTYEITSGGTAVLERFSAGQPHEMVTVYHLDGDDVGMTHYCMLGNQPRMKLEKSDGNNLFFDFEGATGLASKKDPHMHALKLSWLDGDRFQHEWTLYEKGKPTKSEVFTFKRKK